MRILNTFKNSQTGQFVVKTASAGSALLASSAAFATDHTTSITGASTEAQANNVAAVGAVIAVAVIGFGVGLIVMWMKR